MSASAFDPCYVPLSGSIDSHGYVGVVVAPSRAVILLW